MWVPEHLIHSLLTLLHLGVDISADGTRWEGEKRENMIHGKQTVHAFEKLTNAFYVNGRMKSFKVITDKNESLYLAGIPHKALAPNWSEFV